MGDDESAAESNRLIEEQIAQNKQEIEQKRRSLAEEQFRIIKTQGAQMWSSSEGTPLGMSPPANKHRQPVNFGEHVPDAVNNYTDLSKLPDHLRR
jgi:hypothetical protein